MVEFVAWLFYLSIMTTMNLNHAARCLEMLGNPTRLDVYRLLVRAGPEGLAVGDVQDHLAVPASTLSHHLAKLLNVGLIEQVREGRVLRCRPDFDKMDSLMAFLQAECCLGVGAAAKSSKAG